MIFASSSSARTRAFARRVAARVLADASRTARRRATVVALSGELGSGKTTFTQGFARALGARGLVVSPTFIIMRRMSIQVARDKKHVTRNPFANLYHIDAYRLTGGKALAHLDFKRVLAEPKNVILIEWPERIAKALPHRVIKIRFLHGKKESERTLQVIGVRL